MLKELAHHGPSLLVESCGVSTRGNGSRLANFFVQFSVIICKIQVPAAAFSP